MFQEFALRIFLVSSIQSILLGMFLFFIVVILRRNRTRLSYLLSSYFGLLSLGIVLEVIATAHRFSWSVFLYVAGVFLIYLSLGCFVLFTFYLVYGEKRKYGILYLSVYAFFSLILNMMPNGMQYSASTDWIPVWNFEFFFWSAILISLFVAGPELFLFFKLYKKTRHKIVKKKMGMLLIGISIQLVSMYLIGIYNAFPENAFFRAMWGVLTFILILLSGLMIYLGIGKNLE